MEDRDRRAEARARHTTLACVAILLWDTAMAVRRGAAIDAVAAGVTAYAVWRLWQGMMSIHHG